MTRFELKVCAVVVAIAFLHSVSAHGQPANVEVQELLGGDGATLVRSGGSPPLDSETAVIGSGNAAEKKNVILIMADDFNHWLASVGYYPLAKTPNLDALAAKGVLFANTSSASPVCSSSRQALWSGLSPARTLIDTNVEPYIRDIPEYSDVLTMNQHFLQQGYYVYGGGKLYHSSRMGIGETDRKNWSGVYEGKTGAPAGEFYGWQGQANEGRIHWSASAAPIEDTDDTKLAMHMAEKISTYDRSENNDKPFFLAVGFYRPHLPWHAPKQFYDLYDPDKVEIPRGYFDNDLVDIVGARATDEHEEIVKESKWPEAIRAYLANLSYADYNVGIVLNALENSPYRDNTIVVFTGDHGYHLGEKERWKKSALYDQASRTTMITFDPGRTTNSGISNKAVSMLDLYPTIVSLAGLSVPQHVDGRNLERLLDSPNDPNWNFPILIRYSGVNVIKTNEWRFVDSGRRSQLYDMVNDPYELNNLYEDSSYSETVQILRQQLLALASGEEPPPQENLAPQIQINSPLTNSSYNSGTNVSLSGSASDAEDGNLGAQISWSSNLDGMLGTGVNISVSLTDGQHTITAGVTDSGGRSASASIAISMLVNSAPVVVINAPVNKTSVEGDLVQFSGTASDAEDGDLSNSISWTSNRDGDIGTGSSPSTSSLSVGLHSVSARVTDSAGDTATASVNLEVLQAAPPPPPLPPPPTPPPAPVSTDSSGGGGALGGLSVMMLIGICVRRRRIGAYTSTEK